MSVERSARKREACVDIGVHEQTRLNVNPLPALLNESHEVCFGKRHESRTSVDRESAMQKQTKAAHIALSLCALSPALGAFNLSLLSISMHDVAFNRFCLLFTFFFCSQRDLRMLLPSLSLTVVCALCSALS